MRSLKTIFSFVIPLSIMLITFSMYLFTQEVIENYEVKIADDYSIVVITNTPLVKDDINTLGGINVAKIVTLNQDEIIKKVESSLSKDALFLLKKRLPHFYTIHLERFPTTSQLEVIKKELDRIPNINRVEIFSKDHNKIFSLLILTQKIIIVFFIISLLFSFTLYSKQIQIWFYEHNVKISIMQLHGASILYSAGSVIKQALIAAFIAFLLTSGLILLAFENFSSIVSPELQSIVELDKNLDIEFVYLFVLSQIISITTIIGVLFKYKIKSNE